MIFREFKAYILDGAKKMLSDLGTIEIPLLIVHDRRVGPLPVQMKYPKDMWRMVTLTAVSIADADMYAFITDAWFVDGPWKKGDPLPRNHPNRKEALVVSIFARDKTEYITIPYIRKPCTDGDLIQYGTPKHTSHSIDNIIGNVFGMIDEERKRQAQDSSSYVV